MPSSFLVRFRPTGPWRFGPGSGARDQTDLLLHSDAVYSAVSSAMLRLGMLEDWLAATARSDAGSAVRFSSLFPFQRDTLFVTPPRTVWPPPPSIKVRYKGARFVPLNVVESLLEDKPLDEDRWQVDGESACLVPSGWHDGPCRVSLRFSAAVDRVTPGKIEPHATACLEFTREAGLWLLAVFEDEEARTRWEQPVASAFRLLADSGMGGERSRGWGRSREPKWEPAASWAVPEHMEGIETGYWMLSVFAPAASDAVDWSRGNYATVIRSGRVESPASWGQLKPASEMVAEGSVLIARQLPRGFIEDLAPAGVPHPVYRAGLAVCVPIPYRVHAGQSPEAVTRPA